MKKSTMRVVMACILAMLGTVTVSAQCTFTGLNPMYCLTSPNAQLTTTATGGQFYGNGVFGSTFSPSLAGIGTSTVGYGTCTGTYAVYQTTLTGAGGYSPVPVNASSESGLSLGDDQVSGSCAIGFGFQFYCQTYFNFYVSSNGFISFNNNNVNGCCQGASLPSGTTPDNLIAFCWDDLYPPAGGTISYTTVGTAPFRKCLINFVNIQHFSSGNPITVQLQLHETTNLIEIHTATITTDGSPHTQGVQNSGGFAGTATPGRNASTSWLSSYNELVRYTPGANICSTQTVVIAPTTVAVTGNTLLCSGQTTTLTAGGTQTAYSWSGGSSATSSAIVVNPTSTTAYSITATNAIGCVATGAATVNVSGGVPQMTIAGTNSICLGKTVTLTATGANSYTWANSIPNGGTVQPQTTTQYVVSGTNGCGVNSASITVTVTPLPIVISTTPQIICAGNTVTMAAIAAATNYTWAGPQLGATNLFSTVASPTTSSIYTVAATDGTCIGRNTITLTPNPVPVLTITSSTLTICEGNSATLSVSGATGYVWSPGGSTNPTIVVTPSASTLYSVVGTNTFGCTSKVSSPIVVQAAPKLNLSADFTVVCPNGTVNLTATGAPTISWANGPAGPNYSTVVPTPQTYTAMGTGTNGCSSTATIMVNVFSPTITVTGPTVVCAKQTATLTASGADVYSWNGFPSNVNVINPTVTTVYTLQTTTTATDQVTTCNVDIEYTVHVNPNPSVTAQSSRSVICQKTESSTLTANGAVNYLWTGISGTISTAASITVSNNIAVPLTYTATGTDANGCSSSTVITVKVNACTGIAEKSMNGISIYPNPNNGNFTIESDRVLNFAIYNQIGQMVREYSANPDNHYKVDVTGLAAGVYYVKGISEGKSFSEKIVINN